MDDKIIDEALLKELETCWDGDVANYVNSFLKRGGYLSSGERTQTAVTQAIRNGDWRVYGLIKLAATVRRFDEGALELFSALSVLASEDHLRKLLERRRDYRRILAHLLIYCFDWTCYAVQVAKICLWNIGGGTRDWNALNTVLKSALKPPEISTVLELLTLGKSDTYKRLMELLRALAGEDFVVIGKEESKRPRNGKHAQRRVYVIPRKELLLAVIKFLPYYYSIIRGLLRELEQNETEEDKLILGELLRKVRGAESPNLSPYLARGLEKPLIGIGFSCSPNKAEVPTQTPPSAEDSKIEKRWEALEWDVALTLKMVRKPVKVEIVILSLLLTSSAERLDGGSERKRVLTDGEWKLLCVLLDKVSSQIPHLLRVLRGWQNDLSPVVFSELCELKAANTGLPSEIDEFLADDQNDSAGSVAYNGTPGSRQIEPESTKPQKGAPRKGRRRSPKK